MFAIIPPTPFASCHDLLGSFSQKDPPAYKNNEYPEKNNI